MLGPRVAFATFDMGADVRAEASERPTHADGRLASDEGNHQCALIMAGGVPKAPFSDRREALPEALGAPR
jgi:hypothetical protein